MPAAFALLVYAGNYPWAQAIHQGEQPTGSGLGIGASSSLCCTPHRVVGMMSAPKNSTKMSHDHPGPGSVPSNWLRFGRGRHPTMRRRDPRKFRCQILLKGKNSSAESGRRWLCTAHRGCCSSGPSARVWCSSWQVRWRRRPVWGHGSCLRANQRGGRASTGHWSTFGSRGPVEQQPFHSWISRIRGSGGRTQGHLANRRVGRPRHGDGKHRKS